MAGEEKKSGEKSGDGESIIDKFALKVVDFVFSKEKSTKRWLLVLLTAGFILRLIAALNLDVLADDMVYASQSAGILKTGILSTHSNPPLFFYLTDIAYRIFGFTTFASRFWPLIAGTALILVIFLITKRFFSERIALFAAFFAAFSSFLARMTFTEQSMVIFFFAFLAIYAGFNYLDTRKISWLIFSASLFGIALLIKYNTPFFILSFLVFSLYYIKTKKEKLLTNKNLKHLILFLLIIFIFALPFLSFNYFLYKDKGIVDVYFSRVIKVEGAQQLYGGLAGQERSFFDNLTLPSNYGNYNLIFKTDLIMFLFSAVGLGLFIMRKHKTPLSFFLIFLIIPFILQSAGAPLAKHFAFMPLLFAIPAGYSLNELAGKIKGKSYVISLITLLIIIMLFSLGISYGTPPSYISKSSTSQLKSYIQQNVQPNDLVILDSRIYTAQAIWLATPYHYIDLIQFVEFYSQQSNVSDFYKSPTNIYVVECAKDDCGWGTIKDQPELNATAEVVLQQLVSTSPVKTIQEDATRDNEIFGRKDKIQAYKVYKIPIQLNPSLVQQTDLLNQFYFVPYLYKDMSNYIFNYELYSTADMMLDSFARIILFVSIILALVSFLIAIIMFIRLV